MLHIRSGASLLYIWLTSALKKVQEQVFCGRGGKGKTNPSGSFFFFLALTRVGILPESMLIFLRPVL